MEKLLLRRLFSIQWRSFFMSNHPALPLCGLQICSALAGFLVQPDASLFTLASHKVVCITAEGVRPVLQRHMTGRFWVNPNQK